VKSKVGDNTDDTGGTGISCGLVIKQGSTVKKEINISPLATTTFDGTDLEFSNIKAEDLGIGAFKAIVTCNDGVLSSVKELDFEVKDEKPIVSGVGVNPEGPGPDFNFFQLILNTLLEKLKILQEATYFYLICLL